MDVSRAEIASLSEGDRNPSRLSRVGDDSERGGRKPIAVYSVHGMGQQVQFQEIDKIAEILENEQKRHGYTLVQTTARIVDLVGEPVPRTDLILQKPDGETVEVHVYEAYWAPVTEGRVTLKDAIDFLTQAGWDGFKGAKRPKHQKDAADKREPKLMRWMYDRWQTYPMLTSLRVWFLFMIAVVSALVAVNASLTLILARSQFGNSNGGDVVAGAARLLAIVLVFALLTGASFGADFLTHSARVKAFKKSDAAHPYSPPDESEANRSFGTTRSSFLFLLTLGVLVLAAIPMSLMTTSPDWVRETMPFLLPAADDSLWGRFWPWLVLGVSAFVAKKVRDWIVGYVGDLAAYLSSNRASKFEQVRAEIKKRACEVLSGIYQAKTGDGAAYDDVIVVSHSLGSVVAYDALNTVIRNARLYPSKFPTGPGVPERTALFLTCGSPLDTTAYLFRIQFPGDPLVREMLATSMQPMILAPEFRPRRWINFHTGMDPISSALTFYNPMRPPNAPGIRVEERIDTLGTIPFVSHSDYFAHPVLRQELVQEVMKYAR